MTQFIRIFVLLLAAVSTAFAQPASLDLKGKTLAGTFNELRPDLPAAGSGKRIDAQQKWQELCFQVGASRS